MEFSYTVSTVAAICGSLKSQGDYGGNVTGVSSLGNAQTGDLSFLTNGKYRKSLASTKASVVLIPANFESSPREGQVFLSVENPSLALTVFCREIERELWPWPKGAIHPSAAVSPEAEISESASIGPFCVIESGAKIGPSAWIEAGCFVGRNVSIGERTRLWPGVRVLLNCEVGARGNIHPGVVIGGDGFGYDMADGRHQKNPQVGNVMIGDDVEIGANSTVDRARFGSTVVGDGTKIDNLVQIGHNCAVGRHCLLCAQVGLAGTTTVEDYVVLGGQAGTGGHLTIGKGSMVGGQSGVHTSLPAGSKVRASPMMPLLAANRYYVLREKLPELFRRVDSLELTVGLKGDPADSASR